jgi:hypothetical protein
MRKLYILTMAMVCLSLASQAQITKGSTFLGGSFSFGGGSGESENPPNPKSENFGWTFRPQSGKAISTNKVLGLFLTAGSDKTEYRTGVSKSITKSSSYGGGVFLRQYHPLSSRFYLFGDGSLGVAFTKYERKDSTVFAWEDKITNIGLSITPGISFAASQRLHLEAALNSLVSMSYSSSERTYGFSGATPTKENNRYFSVGANANGFSGLSVGLRWIFPSKS